MHACKYAAITATTVTEHDPLAKQPLWEKKEEDDIIIDDLGRSIENAERTLNKKLILGKSSSDKDDTEESSGGKFEGPRLCKGQPMTDYQLEHLHMVEKPPQEHGKRKHLNIMGRIGEV